MFWSGHRCGYHHFIHFFFCWLLCSVAFLYSIYDVILLWKAGVLPTLGKFSLWVIFGLAAANFSSGGSWFKDFRVGAVSGHFESGHHDDKPEAVERLKSNPMTSRTISQPVSYICVQLFPMICFMLLLGLFHNLFVYFVIETKVLISMLALTLSYVVIFARNLYSLICYLEI